jgi:hypothetical protein
MATSTSRLNATKPASSENVSITTLNDNFDLFDAAVGATVGASSARPASAFSGRLWHETDTGLFKVNTALSASTAATWETVSVGVVEHGLWVDNPAGVGGAAPTGTTDASSVFQTKIDSLNTAGGGTLFIPENKYTLSMVRLHPKVRIQGSGAQQYFSESGRASLLALPTAAPSAQLIGHIYVTAGGSGYATTPTVTFTGGGGSGATATAWVSGGAVVMVEITDPGSGYTSVPTIGFTGGGGSGATATALRSTPIFYTRGSSAVFNNQISGINFQGSGTVGGVGLYLHDNWAWKVNDSHFYSFDREAIYNLAGAGGTISDCKIFGLARTTTAQYVSGALRVRGDDVQLSNLEVGADDSTDSTNLWNCAILTEGSAVMANNIVAEGADVGWLHTGARGMFTNVRTDINQGHGFWVKRINISRESPHRNMFNSVWSHHNGNYANNSYDAFRIDSGHTIVENIITSLRTEGNDSSPQHRYGLYDGPNNTIMGSRVFHHHRNYAASGTTAGFFAGPGG